MMYIIFPHKMRPIYKSHIDNYILNSFINYFSLHCGKIPQRSNSKEGGFIWLAVSEEFRPIMMARHEGVCGS